MVMIGSPYDADITAEFVDNEIGLTNDDASYELGMMMDSLTLRSFNNNDSAFSAITYPPAYHPAHSQVSPLGVLLNTRICRTHPPCACGDQQPQIGC